MRRLLVVAASIPMLLAAGAFAGEVKGPPNQPENTNETGAPEHANSNCAYSGLNDFNPDPNVGGLDLLNQTQTAADAFKLYGYRPGVQGRGDPYHPLAPADDGLCKGGTNADRGGEED